MRAGRDVGRKEKEGREANYFTIRKRDKENV
jgi:hypothetical protein